jgi:phosphoglycolate phosphatase
VPEKLPALIFDLDGTLTDSRPGILGCLQKVLDNRNLRDHGPLDRFIGPPVEQWVAELLPQGSDRERTALADDYRACYEEEGWCNDSLYAGVREMLGELHGQGFPLYVCTSKRLSFAVRILDLFAISNLFAAIYGDSPELISHGKTELLASLLRERAIEPANAWMIGDRVFDIRAARGNGVRSVAAAWGYGNIEEWAEADLVAFRPTELSALVQRQQGQNR